MCVSSEFCEKHLQLLFTILEKSKDATIRSNVVIALGDMAVCFSTLIDDNITFLYNRLSDPDTLVKKNAVMVLTHLILNGMVKVKGQISEMAKCLEDADQRIADLAKLFFTELASKDNAIYNNLPDIISNLTDKNNPQRLEEEGFKRVMKFLFSFDFVEKEKQAENIVDKLCQRFLTAGDDERTWRDIAYCLSLLPYKSERSLKRLIEGWSTYQDKLHEDQVHKYFLEIISKCRLQKSQKPEVKSLVDELEQKIEKIRGPKESENGDDLQEDLNAGTTAKRGNATKTKKREIKKKTPASEKSSPATGVKRRRSRKIEYDEESDEEIEEYVAEEDDDDEEDEDDEDEDEDDIEEEEEEEERNEKDGNDNVEKTKDDIEEEEDIEEMDLDEEED